MAPAERTHAPGRALAARPAAAPTSEASGAATSSDAAATYTPTTLLMFKHAEALTARGELALARGDFSAAYGHFDSATTLDPTSAAAWRGLGTAAFQLGHGEEAVRARRRANRLGQ